MIARRMDFVLFTVIAFALAWVAGCGPWVDGHGLKSALWLHSGALLMMLTPTVGVLAVWRYRARSWQEFVSENGLTLGSRPRRTVALIAAAWTGTPLFLLVAFGISAVFGWYTVEFGRLEVVAAVLLDGLTVNILGTVVFALGEEIGWRGWLLPQLAHRFGLASGLLITGVVWALWHAPLTLLGYNYPNLGPWAALAFIGFCVPCGAILGWLRMRTGSIWPCVIAHATLNAAAIPFSLFESPEHRSNPVLTGFGLVGWAVLALIATALFTRYPPHSASRSRTWTTTSDQPQPLLG
ncbi:lysostaphin resistance A-like protein [Nocardia sp. CA-129566]|uniref:CPBP family intramembrane glutamic endopeptidase n=1 Tax=Nocardia sp. CA-129566 TaxID=3239976 RepID=UPI003D990CAB